jgi:hypothetical protein
MDWFTFDRILALLGFTIALWQLHRTHTAAEAARVASGKAVEAIRRLEAAARLHDIASRSRELSRLLRAKTLGPAAPAAFELRDTVARFRHDEQSKKVVSDEVWTQAVSDVRAVHERLESLAMTSKTSPDDREALIHEVSRLHTLFTELAAKAASDGAVHADSE